jgi:hypothetical protein
MDLELTQVALAKQQLDAELLPVLEKQAKACEDNIEHLLGVLEGSLRASAHVSQRMAAGMQTAAEETSAAAATAVVAMNELLTKVQELNEEMKPVAEIAAQVKAISSTLEVLEKAAKKLEKKQAAEQARERDARN